MTEEERQALKELREWCKKHCAAIHSKTGDIDIVIKNAHFATDIFSMGTGAITKVVEALFKLDKEES
jgi:hypothetical protein